MENIILDKKQSKSIAQAVYGDVKTYCQNNIDRYVPWFLNELCKAKGKPPLRRIIVKANPCSLCWRRDSND